MNLTFWTVIIAYLVAINTTLIGSFLVVRKQAMLGDAISHSALLGIVIAFLATGSMHPVIILVGAIIAGVVNTLLVGFLQHQIRISTDVAITFTVSLFFALAILLIVLYTEKVDLDLECVLYGQLPMMPFDVWMYQGYNLGPKTFYLLTLLLITNVGFIYLCYPQLILTSFDPTFASIIGVNTKRWHYSLMIMTALTTVLTYKVVGSVLVLGFLVIPINTIYLISSKSLSKIIIYSFILNLYIILGGYQLALATNGSIIGATITTAGIFFLLSFALYRYKKSTTRSSRQTRKIA